MADWLIWQLVDSAFPTGSFAHSFGLEAAWQQGEVEDADALAEFLRASIQQTGFTALPLLNGAYDRPESYEALDELADAFFVNAVANRASRVQGRSLAATIARVWPTDGTRTLVRRADASLAHLAPLSGVAFRTLDVPRSVAQQAVLYTAARGVLAAAVRLGIAGSYEAQRLQHACAPWLDEVAGRCAHLTPDALAQTAPVVDLLQAAHDRLYSRLFQS